MEEELEHTVRACAAPILSRERAGSCGEDEGCETASEGEACSRLCSPTEATGWDVLPHKVFALQPNLGHRLWPVPQDIDW